MTYLIAALFGVTAFGVVWLAGQVVWSQSLVARNVRKQLALMQEGDAATRQRQQRRQRTRVRNQIQRMIKKLGHTFKATEPETDGSTRQFLAWAGWDHEGAMALYTGTRVAGALLGLLIGGGLAAALGWEGAGRMLAIFWLVLLGWMLPFLYVKRRKASRQDELERSLPDMLDLLVVCMEAGLGFNQALMKVADQIQTLSPDLSEELALTLLEMQTGQDRAEALRGLYKRTGVDELHSLASMLIHADRYGTSIGKALRAHSESVRRRRRQIAQEKAAKISVKMLLPLVFMILPTLFVVVLGPAVFHVANLLTGM